MWFRASLCAGRHGSLGVVDEPSCNRARTALKASPRYAYLVPCRGYSAARCSLSCVMCFTVLHCHGVMLVTRLMQRRRPRLSRSSTLLIIWRYCVGCPTLAEIWILTPAALKGHGRHFFAGWLRRWRLSDWHREAMALHWRLRARPGTTQLHILRWPYA